MPDSISIDLGSALPYLVDRTLALVGKDSDSLRWRSRLNTLVRLSATEASQVQCVGMPNPIPIQQIYQPLDLITVKNGVPSHERFDELLEHGTNRVIFAGPGRGKTTLLHWAYIHLMNSKSQVPILFTLRWPEGVDMLAEFVDGLCQGRTLKRKDGEVVILVDGYDEIAEDEQKRVSQALMLFASAEIGHFYLTCRSFYDVFELKAQHCDLAPFTHADAVQFVRAFSSASGFEILAEPVLQELYDHGFQDFASHPLMLALVCILQTGPEKEIPRRAIGLIERAIQTLTLRWDQSKGVRRQTDIPVDGYERVRCLSRLAFDMPSLRGRWEVVESTVRRHLHLIQVTGVDPRQLLREIAQWYGVLVPIGPDTWEFVHRTIHDYLAARFWVDSGGFGLHTPKDWTARSAYATCLTPDATRNMVLMLSSPGPLAAFNECLYNRAAFDPIAVGQAFITRIASGPPPMMEARELTVRVKIDEDSFGFFTDEALRALLLVAGQRSEEASKAVALYALGELGARKASVMSHNLVNHLLTMYQSICDWRIELYRLGGEVQSYRLRDVISSSA
jgi:hypothetical protein